MQIMARSILRRCRRLGSSGIAAMEFALMAPVLFVIFGGVTDLSIAIWDHITTMAAVNAGADYAVIYGQSGGGQISGSGDVGGFLSKVATVVAGASRPGATLSTANIAVTYNNATDGSNYGKSYCVPASGVFPNSATSASTCPDGTTPGSFIQIQSTFVYTPLSPLDAVFLSGNYTDTVTVRVQ
jgi:Flp pilus assembly protein TadG